ncbi:MAG: amidohydrolase [Bacteroidia bacterium]|nr:amidohydrolase [Bacteroidia bacterium]
MRPPAFFIVFSIFISCMPHKQKADFLILNASLYKSDEPFSMAQAIAVKNGKFIFVGSNEEARSTYESEKIIDCTGKFIFPGLIDAHCHFYGYALSLRYADINTAKSFEELLQIIAEHNRKFPSSWLIGRGWDQNKWEKKEFPGNTELNKLYPDIPVVLIRVDGHAALANNKALEIAGITLKTKIDGGKIITANGKLTGILLDKACDHIRSFIPEPNGKELEKLLQEAQQHCFSAGLTLLADAGLDRKIVELYDSLQKQNILKMRFYAMLNPTDENFKKYIEKGIYQTDRLIVRSIKLYADGALGSRGALLLKPYEDDKDNTGILVEKPELLKSMITRADSAGYQVNTHAIGDSAVRMILNLYGEFLKTKNDKRWRIEHSQVVHPDDLVKYKNYSVIPAVNTTHATSDMSWAGKRLGEERVKYAYTYKNLLDQNGWLCNGSDFPIESINPLYGFYAAVARKDLQGNPENGFQKENALSREQAMKSMTIWAAKACFWEPAIGSIEAGKFADFIITSQDFMKVDENKIPDIKIEQTFISGECVFNNTKTEDYFFRSLTNSFSPFIIFSSKLIFKRYAL